MAVAATNETGSLVRREVTSLLMRVLVARHSHSSGRLGPALSAPLAALAMSSEGLVKVNGFIGCLTYVRLEVCFFGELALGSRVLLALVGSLLGAIIPGIVRSYMAN